MWLALARAAFGLPAVAAPHTCLRLLGHPRRTESNPARFFVGFFGVRELLLGAFIAALRRNPGQLRAVVALGALADMGDSVLVLRDLGRRESVEPRAALLLASGVAGSAASVALWREIATSSGASSA